MLQRSLKLIVVLTFFIWANKVLAQNFDGHSSLSLNSQGKIYTQNNFKYSKCVYNLWISAYLFINDQIVVEPRLEQIGEVQMYSIPADLYGRSLGFICRHE